MMKPPERDSESPALFPVARKRIPADPGNKRDVMSSVMMRSTVSVECEGFRLRHSGSLIPGERQTDRYRNFLQFFFSRC